MLPGRWGRFNRKESSAQLSPRDRDFLCERSHFRGESTLGFMGGETKDSYLVPSVGHLMAVGAEEDDFAFIAPVERL